MSRKSREIRAGDKFKRLTVIREIPKSERPGSKWTTRARMFSFKCDCGKETIAPFGTTQSCGCLQREKAIQTASKLCERNRKNEAGFVIAYVQTCNRATRNGIEFRLTRDQFKVISQQPCFYCGGAPSRTVMWRRLKKAAGNFVFNGLDRIDSKEAYSVENCVASCTPCNIAKYLRSQQEFFDWIKRVHAHLLSKGFIQCP